MRTYKRKGTFKAVTHEVLTRARDLSRRGYSNRAIATELGFNESSIRRALKKGHQSGRLGRFRSVLTPEQEKEVLNHCKALDSRYYRLTLRSLRHLLFEFAEGNGISHPFNKENKMAGKDFTRNFMKRNRLSLRTPRKTSIARIMGFNKQQLDGYFKVLEEVYQKYKFPPNKIFNMDETGIQTTPNNTPKVIAPTGKGDVSKAVSAEQGQTVSVVCAMSAMGQYIPPYFIFRRKRKNLQLIKGGPTGCDMGISEKGYMTITVFSDWLDHFKKFCAPTETDPVLLILDNHVSHVSYESVSYARKNNIHMLSLPPHSSHKTQPLDKVFFKPLKTYYDAAIDNWSTSHPGQTVTIYDVAELFKQAYERTATIEKATQAFKSTGIYPLDKTIFTDQDFLPSQVTDQENEGEEDIDLDDENNRFIDFHIEDNPVNRDMNEEGALMPVDEENITGTIQGNIEESPIGPIASSSTVPNITPEEIIPLPKIQIKRKRTGNRGLKSTLLTSTPNRERLELELIKRDTKVKMKTAKPKTLFSKILDIKAEISKKAQEKKGSCVRCKRSGTKTQKLHACLECKENYHENCLPKNHELFDSDDEADGGLICPMCQKNNSFSDIELASDESNFEIEYHPKTKKIKTKVEVDNKTKRTKTEVEVEHKTKKTKTECEVSNKTNKANTKGEVENKTKRTKTEGDVTKETKTEGEVTKETKTEGDVTKETKTEGDVTKETKTEGDVTKETKTEGEVTKENKTEGEVTKETKTEDEVANKTKRTKTEGEVTKKTKTKGEVEHKTKETKSLSGEADESLSGEADKSFSGEADEDNEHFYGSQEIWDLLSKK